MSKVTYLIGAGASYLCLPVVTEIPDRLESLRKFLVHNDPPEAESLFPESQTYTFSALKQEVLASLEKFILEVKDHASIDTYAKKLMIRGDEESYIRLKVLMSFSFIYDQTITPPDPRYDGFFASILKSSTEFEDIRIISWNYDYQFEKAFEKFCDTNRLSEIQNRLRVVPRYEHASGSEGREFSICKINGTTSFRRIGDPKISHPLDDFTKTNLEPLLKNFYEYYFHSVTAKQFRKYRSMLSFAWENDASLESVTIAKEYLRNSKALVVIGYSFPFFNRLLDKEILSDAEPRDCKIYIQDLEIERVKTRMLAALPIRDPDDYNIIGIPIIYRDDKDKRNAFMKRSTETGTQPADDYLIHRQKMDQFYLPAEL
jgi:hypothetical protein